VALHIALNHERACKQSLASVEQLFWGLEQQQLAGLLARLIVWLQQSPEVSLEQPAGNSRARVLWSWCMTCLSSLWDVFAGACKSKPEGTSVQCAEHLTVALDEAGGQEGGTHYNSLLL
jgi:hypothetical protein